MSNNKFYKYGDYEVSYLYQMLKFQGNAIDIKLHGLPPRCLLTLEIFIQNQDVVLSREELFRLHNIKFSRTNRSIDLAVARIRKLPQFLYALKTIPKVGYLLMPECEILHFIQNNK